MRFTLAFVSALALTILGGNALLRRSQAPSGPQPPSKALTLADDPEVIAPPEVLSQARTDAHKPSDARKWNNRLVWEYINHSPEELDLEIAQLEADYATLSKEAFDFEVDLALQGNPSSNFGWWDQDAPKGHATLPTRIGAVYNPAWEAQRQFSVILASPNYSHIASMLERLRWLKKRRDQDPQPSTWVAAWNNETKAWDILLAEQQQD